METKSNTTDTTLPKLFDFERNFNDERSVQWMQQTGVPLAVISSVVYVIVIFYIRHFMQSRERKELRSLLIVWNGCLAIFSIIGAWRMHAALRVVLQEPGGGWHKAICDNVHYDSERISGLWLYLFTLSKFTELGDTVFVMLRKSKLIFLHWYHHIFTMCYCVWGYGGRASTAFFCTFMNLAVHSVMYSYYTLRAAGVKVPKMIAIAITTMQISQMIVGAYLYYYVYKMFSLGVQCDIVPSQWKVGSIMYISFLILFMNFFIQVYIVKKPKKAAVKVD